MSFPRRFLLGALAILATAVVPGTAAAAAVPGALHPTFTPLVQRFGDPTGQESATSVTVRDDGRIIVGAFNDVDMDRMILGLLPNGQLDPSFSEDGVWHVPQPDSTIVRAVAATGADGKVLFAGDNQTAGTMVIGRLMKDGELDPSFGGGDGLYVVTTVAGSAPRIEQLLVEPDGKVVFGGTMYVEGKGRQLVIGKLSATGADDAAFVGTPYLVFGAGGSADNDRLGGFVRLPNGEFVMGDAHGTGMTGVWKIGPNGNWSMLKDINLVNTIDEPVDFTVIDQGHVAALVTGTPWATAMVVINVEATPALDVSYGASGIMTPFPPSFRGEQVLRQPDGKFLVAGFDTAPSSHRALLRLDTAGALDPTFGTAGTVALAGTSMRSSAIRMHRIALAGDGSIVSVSHVGAPDARQVAVDRVLGRIAHVHTAVLSSAAAPYVSSPTTVVLRTSNDGPDASGAMVATFSLAPELTLDGATGSTCTMQTPTQGSCPLASIASGSSRDVTLTVRAATAGTFGVGLVAHGSLFDDVLVDDESSRALAFTVAPAKLAPIKVTAPTPSDINQPTPTSAASGPVLPRMTLRRIRRMGGRVMGCGGSVRAACRTARVRPRVRTVPMFLRAVAKPLPGTDKREVKITVQRKERGRFVTRGGGTISLTLKGLIDFTLPVEMRGAPDTWRMQISVAKTPTSSAARSGWFYVQVT